MNRGSFASLIPTAPLDDPWAELERLARAATPGPWGAYGDEVRLPQGGTMFVSFRGNGKSGDAAFIAAARRDVLKLIEAARQGPARYEGRQPEVNQSPTDKKTGGEG